MVLTKTFRRSGLLVLVGVFLCLAGAVGAPGRLWIPAGCVLIILAGPVFAVSAIRHLMRGLLWRVGSRLLVSYLLLVAPLFFFALVVYAGLWLVAGQVAAKRLELALANRLEIVEKTARQLAERFRTLNDAVARKAAFQDAAAAAGDLLDGAGFVWSPVGGAAESYGAPGSEPLLPRSWLPPGHSVFLTRTGRTNFFAGIENRSQGTLVVTLPTGPPLLRSLERQLGVTLAVQTARLTPTAEARPTPGEKTGKIRATVGKESYDVRLEEEQSAGQEPASRSATRDTETSAPAKGSGPLRGRIVFFPVPYRDEIVDWADGKPLLENQVLFILRTSIATEADRLFGEIRIGKTPQKTAEIALAIMTSLGGAAVVFFVLATMTAAILALRISRATRRLSAGVKAIEAGSFSHRIVLKGDDQLARLVRGFNDMASHLEASVAERAEKQALDRELQVARDLQRRLLPPADFAYPGLEIAIDFHPAAAIGGDFYDLVASDPPGVLTVVLADVSGHGLPTGIVMASAKASLSALVQSGAAGEELLSRLDAEIARTTESRTFVTMAFLSFHLAGRRVEYTNAGHVYPYRVTPEGTVAALANPARPLGLGLPVTYRTVEAPLEDEDLWVLFSDGIVEATRPGSDEEFGFARLERALAGAAGGTAVAARDRVLAAWRDFTGGDEPADDRTLIVLRIGNAARDA